MCLTRVYGAIRGCCGRMWELEGENRNRNATYVKEYGWMGWVWSIVWMWSDRYGSVELEWNRGLEKGIRKGDESEWWKWM